MSFCDIGYTKKTPNFSRYDGGGLAPDRARKNFFPNLKSRHTSLSGAFFMPATPITRCTINPSGARPIQGDSSAVTVCCLQTGIHPRSDDDHPADVESEKPASLLPEQQVDQDFRVRDQHMVNDGQRYRRQPSYFPLFQQKKFRHPSSPPSHSSITNLKWCSGTMPCFQTVKKDGQGNRIPPREVPEKAVLRQINRIVAYQY